MGINWSNSYLLNIPEIDQQHKEFFELYDKTNKRFDIKDYKKLETIISQLEEYLAYHFDFEEKLMKEAGYEDLENHRKQHDIFIKRIKEMRLEYNYMNPLLFDKITVFIKKWFISHIMQSDKEYKYRVINHLNLSE